MIAQKYIIVQDTREGYTTDTGMEFFNTERDVMRYIGMSSSNVDEDIKIKRVFKVDEHGKVVFYSIVFADGRFKLEIESEVKQG